MKPSIDLSRNGAIFSACGRYRHLLWRVWACEAHEPAIEYGLFSSFDRHLCGRCGAPDSLHGPVDLYIGLNPSFADATIDDMTVKKWRGFSQQRGRRGYIAANLWEMVSTDPLVLWTTPEKKRHEDHGYRDKWIERALELATGDVVVCWGKLPAGPTHPRARGVLKLIKLSGREPLCFGVTRDGHPKHPSRLAYNTRLRPFEVVNA